MVHTKFKLSKVNTIGLGVAVAAFAVIAVLWGQNIATLLQYVQLTGS